MRHFVPALIIAICSLLSFNIKAQGCSDAGFCTVNSLKAEAQDSTLLYRNSVRLGVSYGLAYTDITVFGKYLEYSRKLSDKWSIASKITTLAQFGKIAKTDAFSDLFLTTSYKASNKLLLTGGIKIPFTKGNKSKHGFNLPMDYQSSLGTYDLILGGAFNIKTWQFALGIQQPINQNQNTFEPANFQNDSNYKTFVSTNKFVRSGDALLRFSKALKLNSKLNVTPGLLSIYHFQEDKFTDTTGVQRKIDGSAGLTLNATAYVDYKLSSKSSFQFNFGLPLVVRKVRPDGLTRAFIASLEYKILF